MKIQLITNLFYPDELAGASLYTDLAIYLRDAGHDVRVTGTFSYYPAWKLRDEDKGFTLRDDEFERIPVRRVKMYVPEQASGMKRLLSDLSFLGSLVRHGRFRDWTPDAVVSACPMLSQCVAQRFLYRGKSVPRLLIVQDFVVDAALELKMLNVPGLGWFLSKMERWALRSADTLSTISPQMLDKLRVKVGEDRHLLFNPNWIHSSLEREIEKQMAHPPERKVMQLLYSGNVGVKQGLPDFVDQFMKFSTPWTLRIQGGGAERRRLEDQVASSSQISMHEVSGEDAYVKSLLETSACLITQKPGVSANFLPSKLLPALATGTPVLAVCEADSPLGREVREGGYGAVIDPEDAVALERTLAQWQEDGEILKSFRELALLRSNTFRRERILKRYEQELISLTSNKAFQAEAIPSASFHETI